MKAKDELIIDTGLSLKQDSKTGREAQSSAFLRTPGIPWLYYGVAINTPSLSAMIGRSDSGGTSGTTTEVFMTILPFS
jgi:hypothetical protein